MASRVAGSERESGVRTCPSGHVLDIQGSCARPGPGRDPRLQAAGGATPPTPARSSGWAQASDSAGLCGDAAASRYSRAAAAVDAAWSARLDPHARTRLPRRSV